MLSLRARVWNWLPTFLAVAEEGSIGAASAALHVTPAAVSRTLRLLEAEIGVQLFNRVGRRLVLNARGAKLREALQGASSVVEQGLSSTLSSAFAGPLRVASLGVLTDHFVVSALLKLKAEYPGLLPEHQNAATADAARKVARGELDVAFYYEDLSVEGIRVELLCETTMSVYCGQGHPLFHEREISFTKMLEYGFSVPQIGDSGRVLDGWPVDIGRTIGMRITTLRSNLEVCRSGLLQCVLPDATAFEDLKAGKLRRITAKQLPPIQVYAARSLGGLEGGAVDGVVQEVRNNIEMFQSEFDAYVAPAP